MISFCTENDELNSDDLFGILIVGFQSRKIIEHIFSSKEVLVQEDFFNNFDNFGEFRHRSSTAKQDQEFDFFQEDKFMICILQSGMVKNITFVTTLYGKMSKNIKIVKTIKFCKI